MRFILICLLAFCSYVQAANLYLVHGYASDEKYGFFPYLKEEIAKDKDVRIVLKTLPNPKAPSLNSWIEFMYQNYNSLSKDTYFITHSLGGIATLQYLNFLVEDFKIGGIVLVAPFDQKLSHLSLDFSSFLNKKIDYDKLKNSIKHRTVICSSNDSVVPFAMCKSVAQKLEAKLVVVENAGHFMESEGFKSLPIALKEFKLMYH